MKASYSALLLTTSTTAMDELCAMVWYAIVSHLACQAPAKCQVPYHRPSMICCASMPMGSQAHSQVLIQADFSVPSPDDSR